MGDQIIESAIASLRKGKMVILTRVDQGELSAACVTPAARTTPAHINFMVSHARGLVCVALSKLMGQRLKLVPQNRTSRHPRSEDVMVSVEARVGVSTGISAADRAKTISVLGNPDTNPEDIISPGHVIPVTVSEKGVFSQREIPEGAVDLARLSGLLPAATYCKMLSPEGNVMTLEEVRAVAKEHDLPIVDVSDIVHFRASHEVLVGAEEEYDYETAHGTFTLRSYRSDLDESRHLVLLLGDLSSGAPLVRVHSQCLTGDVFGSLRCDCGGQLEESLEKIAAAGRGALVYLMQEGRGIGLANKMLAYALQDKGQDTVEANLSLGFEADARDFGVAAQILTHLGVSACEILTNNPDKIKALEDFGVDVRKRVPLEISPATHSHHYLAVKKEKMGHLLDKV